MPKSVLDQLHAHQCNLIAAAIAPRFRQSKLQTAIIDVGVFRGMYLRDAIAQIVHASDWRMLRTIEEDLFSSGFDKLTREQKVVNLKAQIIDRYCQEAGKSIDLRSKIVEFNEPASKDEVDLIYAFRMARFDHRSLDRKEMQTHYGVPASFELTDKQLTGPDAELLLILRTTRSSSSKVRRTSSTAELKLLGAGKDIASVDNSVYSNTMTTAHYDHTSHFTGPAKLLSPVVKSPAPPPRPLQFSRSPSNIGLSKSASKGSLDLYPIHKSAGTTALASALQTSLPTIMTDGLSQLDSPPPPPPGHPYSPNAFESGYGDYEEPSDALATGAAPVAIGVFWRRN
jgi:hypothetical protein